MTTLGFQVVLLDEQDDEIDRIADVYDPHDSQIVVDDATYVLQDVHIEDGQRVRYFKLDSSI